MSTVTIIHIKWFKIVTTVKKWCHDVSNDVKDNNMNNSINQNDQGSHCQLAEMKD